MKKLHRFRDFIIGMLVMAVLCSAVVPAVAAVVQKQITVAYNGMRVYVDGREISPKDSNGKAVEPIKKREFDRKLSRNGGKVNEIIRNMQRGVFGQERISNKPGNDIEQEIGKGAMTRVFNLADIFEEIIYRLNDCSLA